MGGRPGRGWRRRCRRRRRRGCRCRSCRRRHCLLLRPRRGERTSESGGEEPGAHHSWIPHSNFKPRPRLSPANLTANRRASPVQSRPSIGRPPCQCGRGYRGENHSWNPVPTPKPGPPFYPPLAPGFAPEGWGQSDDCPDRTHFPIGLLGLWDSPGREPREIKVFGIETWDNPTGL